MTQESISRSWPSAGRLIIIWICKSEEIDAYEEEIAGLKRTIAEQEAILTKLDTRASEQINRVDKLERMYRKAGYLRTVLYVMYGFVLGILTAIVLLFLALRSLTMNAKI
eukprot:Protomagalhaensia_wolfi_Nauph_80__4709@NODE_4882_length_486_cov_110_539150_g3951_i0_p1_GENE_NODE_4882_length_486_cov_110_539150_g3951_i0NODE_4882_length_486_cov_110_539150_g3951_i0_p1_ORF_typecomplete_len110_score15_53Sensor/PF13796_6/0_0015HAUSaugmin3/PF14932_6/0_009YscO/PF07321_12/0_012SlyX/PF04102_12/0_015MtrB/PF05440_12/0_018Csm1_N/PF18504_1/0_052DUF3450/PF11932_8/0_058Med9/PF07544_13/0_11DUF2570/PF10828_8/0_074DUF2570/PF10828_8/6_3e03DUF1180/PF06679_12/0_22_NODE_4882_length_486_cov_110_5391